MEITGWDSLESQTKFKNSKKTEKFKQKSRFISFSEVDHKPVKFSIQTHLHDSQQQNSSEQVIIIIFIKLKLIKHILRIVKKNLLK